MITCMKSAFCDELSILMSWQQWSEVKEGDVDAQYWLIHVQSIDKESS